MKRSRYTEEQIVGILNEVEAGATGKEACRRHEISAQRAGPHFCTATAFGAPRPSTMSSARCFNQSQASNWRSCSAAMKSSGAQNNLGSGMDAANGSGFVFFIAVLPLIPRATGGLKKGHRIPIECWQRHYNEVRPHKALGCRSLPGAHRAGQERAGLHYAGAISAAVCPQGRRLTNLRNGPKIEGRSLLQIKLAFLADSVVTGITWPSSNITTTMLGLAIKRTLRVTLHKSTCTQPGSGPNFLTLITRSGVCCNMCDLPVLG